MNILLSSDWHLGLSRAAHTTPESSKRLQEAMERHLMQTIESIEHDAHFCLGDMFDTYSNPEAVINRARQPAAKTDLILAGNHDLRNSSQSMGSLQFLAKLDPGKYLVNEWGDHSAVVSRVGRTTFVFIPHVPSQDAFEEALADAVKEAEAAAGFKVLCLHSNFAAEGLELSDSALNLSRDKAHELLASFHFIFMGHEHVPREEFNGRLVIIGNHHPTGFSDMSSKRVVTYDTEQGEWKNHEIFDLPSAFWCGKASQLDSALGTQVFLDLEDDLPKGEVFQKVTELFKTGQYFAIRLRSPQESVAEVQAPGQVEMQTLPSVVGGAIEKEKPTLIPLWEELLDAAQA